MSRRLEIEEKTARTAARAASRENYTKVMEARKKTIDSYEKELLQQGLTLLGNETQSTITEYEGKIALNPSELNKHILTSNVEVLEGIEELKIKIRDWRKV